MKLLVTRLRQTWPDVKIIFRGDSGFCRHKMLRWCERSRVDYLVGLAKHSRLLALAAASMPSAAAQFESTQEKQRHFGWLDYAAGTWDRERRVIAQAEHRAQGANPRFVVTSLEGDAQAIYDEIYCARGELESSGARKPKGGAFARRAAPEGAGKTGSKNSNSGSLPTALHATACSPAHRPPYSPPPPRWANQFRLLLSAAACVLLETIRRVGLAGTELARAQGTTLRLKVLKLGTVIVRNTRRIRLRFSSAYPDQELFGSMLRRLSSA